MLNSISTECGSFFVHTEMWYAFHFGQSALIASKSVCVFVCFIQLKRKDSFARIAFLFNLSSIIYCSYDTHTHNERSKTFPLDVISWQYFLKCNRYGIVSRIFEMRIKWQTSEIRERESEGEILRKRAEKEGCGRCQGEEKTNIIRNMVV